MVDVVVMRDAATKRSRGFGFITYTKSAMVDTAQENRPHIIDGKYVSMKFVLLHGLNLIIRYLLLSLNLALEPWKQNELCPVQSAKHARLIFQ